MVPGEDGGGKVTVNPESVDKHDPYTNDRFIDLFRQEGNEELARMFAVALPINDAPAVVPEPTVPEGSTMVLPVTHDHDQVSGVDKDGDRMRVSYVQGVTQEYDTDAAIIFRVSEGGFLMPIERVPGFIAWLNSRVAKHARGEA